MINDHAIKSNDDSHARGVGTARNKRQPAHHRSIQTQNIEDGHLPFSEILLFLEELGADAGLAIETAQMKLFNLEALISFNILHDNVNDNNVIKAEKMPRHQELYQKGALVALVILMASLSRSTRCTVSLIPVLNTSSQSRSYPHTLLR